MQKRQALTYDDLADIYDKSTSGKRKARTQPMSIITGWAQLQPDLITYDEDEDLFYRVNRT